jgi:RNA polymerase sigma factor (sigma-70 family)
MATGQLGTVIDHLRRTAGRPDVAGLTDGELLGAFLARQDAAALEALVRRHAGLVHGVCRRVLGNAADADDAFQATFLVLVRRAASVRPREKVGNWLYGVAYKTALAARRQSARRRAREKQVTEMPHPLTGPDQARLDLQQLLDRELSQLPEKYRLPVVLCDLEGRTRREVASQLRLPEGTLSNRLTAGRQRLAGRLKRRGLALSTAAVATLLEQEASARAPAALVTVTVNTALQVAATPAALAVLLPSPVATLTQGVLQTMWLAKLKLTVAAVFALGVVGAGTAWTFHPAQEPTAAKVAAPQKEDAAKKARARSQELLRDALKEFNDAGDVPGAMRHRVLADMATLYARLGDRPAAMKLFEQAREIVAAIPPESGQSGEWRVVATAAAKAGEMDEAVAMARQIPDGEPIRDVTFQEVATELANLRREKDALRVGKLIEKAETKEWVLSMLLEKVALAHAKAGDIPHALRVVERMEKPASKALALAGMAYFNLWDVEYPNEPGIALLQAEAGDKAGARKTLARAAELAAAAPESVGRQSALTAVACAQARLGDFAAARKTAEGIRHAQGNLIALATISRNLARVGQSKDALAAVERATNAADKAFLLIHVGAGQAKAGDRKAARGTLRKAYALIEGGDDKVRNHAHSLVSALAAAGAYKEAQDAAAAFLSEGSLANVNIAYTRAEAGDYAGAIEMAQGLQDSVWWRGNLLRGIGKLQAQRGREKAALEWIGRLEAFMDRANGLLGVAEGLVEGTRGRDEG